MSSVSGSQFHVVLGRLRDMVGLAPTRLSQLQDDLGVATQPQINALSQQVAALQAGLPASSSWAFREWGNTSFFALTRGGSPSAYVEISAGTQSGALKCFAEVDGNPATFDATSKAPFYIEASALHLPPASDVTVGGVALSGLITRKFQTSLSVTFTSTASIDPAVPGTGSDWGESGYVDIVHNLNSQYPLFTAYPVSNHALTSWSVDPRSLNANTTRVHYSFSSAVPLGPVTIEYMLVFAA